MGYVICGWKMIQILPLILIHTTISHSKKYTRDKYHQKANPWNSFYFKLGGIREVELLICDFPQPRPKNSSLKDCKVLYLDLTERIAKKECLVESKDIMEQFCKFLFILLAERKILRRTPTMQILGVRTMTVQ